MQGFPTLKLFLQGQGGRPRAVDYAGARQAAAVVEWALDQVKRGALSRLGAGAGGAPLLMQHVVVSYTPKKTCCGSAQSDIAYVCMKQSVEAAGRQQCCIAAQAGDRSVTWEGGEAAVLPVRRGPCNGSVQ